MAKSEEPTKLQIKRDKMDFTCSWTKGDKDYDDGQEMIFYVLDYTQPAKSTPNLIPWLKSKKMAKDISIGKSTTSKNITKSKMSLLDLSKWYPNKPRHLESINFLVRGNRKSYREKDKKSGKEVTRKPGWSDWAGKSFKVEIPKKPTLTATLSSDYSNVCTFTWSVDVSDSSKRIFTDVEYQTVWTKEASAKNVVWPKTSVEGKKKSGSVTYTENSALFTSDKYSYTRWFRVRARGPAGHTEWVTRSHTYARSGAATIVKASATQITSSRYKILVTWKEDNKKNNPQDAAVAQYCVDTPDAAGAPSSPSWSDLGKAIKDTTDWDSVMQSVDVSVPNDQAIYVRVVTTHDEYETASEVKRVFTQYLEPPETPSISSSSPSTRTIAVQLSNNCTVPDPNLKYRIYFKTGSKTDNSIDCVVVNVNGSSQTATIRVPSAYKWSSIEELSVGVEIYSPLLGKTSKEKVWYNGTLLPAPSISLSVPEGSNDSMWVNWTTAWSSATGISLEWSDDPDAWESTDGPSTYTLNQPNASRWKIAGISAGQWYVKARMFKESDNNTSYGPYSNLESITITSTPSIPSLTLSKYITAENSTITCYWAFVAADGTTQMNAEICEAFVDEGAGTITYGGILVTAGSEQHIDLTIPESWKTGETHYLCVRVTSSAGVKSDGWSAYVKLVVANPPVPKITETSLTLQTVVADDETGETREAYTLSTLPLTVTVTGAGEMGTTILTVERAAPSHMARPDENDFDGYEGETIAQITHPGEGEITISKGSLIGSFDDTAQYRLVATVIDSYGQSDSTSVLPNGEEQFEVWWEHQAILPEAVSIVNTDDLYTVIRVLKPNGALDGDVCDIYRLSADKPELIYSGAEFDKDYVDPYPALGVFGGHRIVYRTFNDDYTTKDREIAWLDLVAEEDILDVWGVVIDFGGDRVQLPYNIDLSNSWSKDFTETKYLGGSVQGDWNAAVSRTASVDTVTWLEEDAETIEAMRRLAVYPGVCKVRTPDGSCFSANVNVSESRESQWVNRLANFSLDITRVDSVGFDGVPYEDFALPDYYTLNTQSDDVLTDENGEELMALAVR